MQSRPTHIAPETSTSEIVVSNDGTLLTVTLKGVWCIDTPLPNMEPLRRLLTSCAPRLKAMAFDASGVTRWDSMFLGYCRKALAIAVEAGLGVDTGGLPPGAASLLDLAAKVPERKGAARHTRAEPFLARIGSLAIGSLQSMENLLEFIGDVTQACGALLRGRAVFQTSTLSSLIKQSGIDALPIVSLISLLVGLILAFVGAIQLRQFGAQIYVSTIVGIAMLRVMGAIMTGIIMAGRTGAAFAAELGTMQVNEEIDALRTLGFSPVEFLVLPRMLALVLMMPLLCIYADLMGILGGFIVGVFMLDINPLQYLSSTWQSVPLANFWIGLVHSTVFGILIALAGCYRGMQCGRSASAVGQATTTAVVTSILSIIIATAIITIGCEFIGL